MAKTYTTNYSKPELDGHKVLYKGRRYWVFEVSADHPFEGEEEYYDLVFWDGFYGAVITGGATGDDGVIRGFIQYGQGGIDVQGMTVREFVDDCVATCEWIQREVDRGIREESKPLYNGRRIKILRGHTLTPPRAGLHIFDKQIGALVGTAKAKEGIAWEGTIFDGMIDVPVTGDNLADFVKHAIKAINKALSEK